jgi:hypothetical protein
MSVGGRNVRRVIIDCETCVMRDLACGDCVVSFLAEPSQDRDGPVLSDAETRAVAVLAGSGLIPPLRMAGSGGTATGGRPVLPLAAARSARRPETGAAAAG